MKIKLIVLVLLSAICICCAPEDGFKGKLVLSITDSPFDADEVKGVNLVLTNVEIKQKGEWKSLRTFEQPVGINLLTYSDGKSFPIVDQLVEPGTFSDMRLRLNVLDGSALIRNPLCNVEFVNGTTQSLLLPAGASPELVITREMTVRAGQLLDLTIDVDARKSVVAKGNEFILTPSIRIVETFSTGSITGKIVNLQESERMIVFAYRAGQFNSGESTILEGIRFKNSITASKVKKSKFTTAFLEPGNYDLVFTKQTKAGEFISVAGLERNITVEAKGIHQLEIDVNKLTGS